MGVGRRTDNKQIITSGETCCGKAKTEQRRRGRNATGREVVMITVLNRKVRKGLLRSKVGWETPM